MRKKAAARLTGAFCLLLLSTARAWEPAGQDAWTEDWAAVEFDGELGGIDWEPASGTRATVTNEGGHAALMIEGAGQVRLTAATFGAFRARTVIQGTGGIRFGAAGQVLLSRSGRGGAITIQTGAGQSQTTRLDRKGVRVFSPLRKHELTVVVTPTFVRVWVDDRLDAELASGNAAAARTLSLVATGNGASFGPLTVGRHLRIAAAVRATPVTAGQALVFNANEAVGIELDIANHSSAVATLHARLCPPECLPPPTDADAPRKGKLIEFGVGSFAQLLPGRAAASEQRTSRIPPAAKTTRQALRFAPVPAGLYLLDLVFDNGNAGEGTYTTMYPVAVNKPLPSLPDVPTSITIGAYCKKLPQAQRQSAPVWWQTYLHRTAGMMRASGMNAVVAQGVFSPPTINIFRQYGISVITRGGGRLAADGVIGTLIGDEPGPQEAEHYNWQYAALRKTTEKPIMTCCVGEGIGLGGPHWFWRQTTPDIRLFRWYGIKKHHYGIQFPLHYKRVLPLEDVLRIADTSFATPYWIVLPTFGSRQHEAYFQFPRAEQCRGMMHLAVAHGAAGMLFYTFQNADGEGLVDKATLRPIGQRLDVIAATADRIGRFADLLRRLDVGGLDIRCDDPLIEPVPLHEPGGRCYVYVINRDTRATRNAELSWPRDENRRIAGFRDLYRAADLAVARNRAMGTINLRLPPGDGVLLAAIEEDEP